MAELRAGTTVEPIDKARPGLLGHHEFLEYQFFG